MPFMFVVILCYMLTCVCVRVCVSYMYILQEDAAPTFFQKKQEKIQKQIKKLEAEAVADKDWALKGEVDITCIYNV